MKLSDLYRSRKTGKEKMSLIDKIIPHLTQVERKLFDEAMTDIERMLEHYGQMAEIAMAKKLSDIRLQNTGHGPQVRGQIEEQIQRMSNKAISKEGA